ncbi:Transcriptional regulator, AbiEi antitoxin, Type IV TA system [Modestobacter sp. DSM 44400]|uniref:type IV toxin-antitoxin system AbiEi family antitoxin domain-containing protein n=1 Tax=Modestobacter sp. DSM 44400 TaxID=1550230 RepID=UPI0008982B42|nr:type IV toxin-antitoxin system AbiEi family antitoxin domain-containing protein [Modestobacter sp. DSM 44400]SDY25154.1 Transcriptional regulator, AbiEi antitoxin, Type IV TA system [Modestobacter sp. DSM 44400]
MHPTLRARAHQQLGVFTAAEARAAGYRPDEMRNACSSGRWVRIRRGVYETTTDLAEVVERRGGRHAIDCFATLAFLGRPQTAVSHSSAARLWGWPLRRDLDSAVRLTDPDQWRRGAGYLVNRAPLPSVHRTTRNRLPITSAARTLVDCAREWDLEDAVVAMDAALLRGQTTDGEPGQAGAAARR